MGIIQKIKDFVNPNRGNDAAPTTPANMLATRHKPYAAQAGVTGNRARQIARFSNSRERKLKFPYQPEIVKAYKEKMSLPIFPEDGNEDNPQYDVLDRYDPGKVKWDD